VPFAFAGRSEHWHRGDQVIDSVTIITTEPNELMQGIHDRMPVILSPDGYDLWLEPDFHGQGKLLEMLRPYPAEEMEAFPVSTVVNNPRNEKKECI
jgi:putative SOS response-associated peptidase YedK